MARTDTIMAKPPSFETSLRGRRLLRGWSQEELARASGLSRAGVSAIEIGRLVPSAAAALALAAALGCRVEDLFRLRAAAPPAVAWAWPPEREPCRYWEADLDGPKRFPVEPTVAGALPHDGVFESGRFRKRDDDADDGPRTLILAGCDPAAGLLAAELARTADVRLIPLPRSSRAALAMLGRGLVHVAGAHLARAGEPDGNAGAVREALGAGYRLVRAARWEEGIVTAPSASPSSIGEALRSNLRWVGREAGSGARQCLDELFDGRRPPRRLASDHRGVAEAVRQGWADAGVCLRLAGEEAGLGFLPVRREDYDLCFPERFEEDVRIQALLRALRSPAYRRLLGELPGYDGAETGALRTVD